MVIKMHGDSKSHMIKIMQLQITLLLWPKCSCDRNHWKLFSKIKKNKKSGPYNNGIISNRWTEEVDQVNKWLLINHSLNIISQLSSSLLQN